MIRGVLVLMIAHLMGGLAGPNHRERPEPVQGCTSAVVSLQGAGRVGVSAHCRGDRRGRRFTLTIESYPLGAGQEDEEIGGFGRHPRLAGPDSSPHFGSCRRIGRAVRCEGKADGPVRMLMALRVSDRDRCRQGYSVTTFEGGGCEKAGACPVSGTVHILAKGRPRGC